MPLFGFGLELLGIPGEWPSGHLPEPLGSIAWSATERELPSTPTWWSEEFDDGFLIGWASEAEYRVTRGNGSRVDVAVGPIGLAEAARLFTLSVLPMSLPLFGFEPFHGSAVALPSGGALMVTGRAEAGKSTTARTLRALGCRFLADDACAIDDNGLLWPGPPVIAARPPDGGVADGPVFDGKAVEEVPDHDGAPRSVAAAVLLTPGVGEDLDIRDVHGRDALVALLSQARSPWLMPARRERRRFHAATRLASSRVAIVSYDQTGHPPSAVAESILEWASR